ncbi:MAG: outer membrane beta-barrel protein [Gracilimonas sp.]|uniref:outer membrane protein n=1 Tax=Gracilimonas sp. TaxID=1974203 RepID=UPI0019B566B2|nr:outer membrane beta-barrel protein [Gracilimonas sp.]MBD3616643.1 outer membrane beta-barrel protein [Gracilimonas sp.]
MKRLITLPLLIVAIFSVSTYAQFEIGASYELRDEDPKNGFGLRIQKGIFEGLPIVNLGLRLHGSYFSEENNVSENNFSYSEDLTNYDVGIAAIGGVSLGLLEPYVGLGLGTQDYKRAISDVQNDPGNAAPESGEESSLYWNMLAGAKVTIIPMLKPFVEYRYSSYELEKPELQDVNSQTGRIMFGVSISF